MTLRLPRAGIPALTGGNPSPPAQHDDAAMLAAAIGPAAVESAPGYLRVGDGYTATLSITGYPPEVGLAWLDAVLAWPGRLDVVQHIEPVPAAVAAGRLRRQRARLESSRRLDSDRGRLGDPVTDAADDAADLADRVARGAARLFRVGHYLCVHAPSREELDDAVAQVRAAAASVLLDTQPATRRQLQAWTSTQYNDGVLYLPAGIEIQPKLDDWGLPNMPDILDRVDDDRPHGGNQSNGKLLCLLRMARDARAGRPPKQVWMYFKQQGGRPRVGWSLSCIATTAAVPAATLAAFLAGALTLRLLRRVPRRPDHGA